MSALLERLGVRFCLSVYVVPSIFPAAHDGMGAFRHLRGNRNKGGFPVMPPSREPGPPLGARFREKAAPQRDCGKDDECDGECAVHEEPEAQRVPNMTTSFISTY